MGPISAVCSIGDLMASIEQLISRIQLPAQVIFHIAASSKAQYHGSLLALKD
jgi:hypothetical protein